MMQPYDSDGDKPTTEHRESYGKDDQAFADGSLNGAKVVEEREIEPSELAEVLLREKTDPWAPHMIKLYLILIPAYLCSTTNGFDSNTFGGASALPQFISYFNLTEGNTQGLLASMYVLGSILATFFSGQIADKLGRKWAMAIGSAIACVGAALQVAASGGKMLIGGRVILGIGAVIGTTAAPAYVVEFSHPEYRAVLTGLYNTMFFSGTIISTFILYGLSYLPNNPKFAWQVPMGLQAAPSALVLLFVWMVPESPRWYMAHGNEAKAREILIKYHGGGNPASQLVELEMREMRTAIRGADGADKRWWDFSGLFRTRSDRHRTFLVACIAFFASWDLPPTSYYFPLMVAAAGVKDTHMQLLLNALQTPIMMISALSGLRFIQRWGRRRTLMASSTGMALSVIMITICTALTPTHPSAGPAGIVFLYVFLVVFAFVWTPMQALYPCEVLAYNNRAKGLAALGFMNNIAGFFNTYVPPVAIRRAGWKFYLFYACWDAIGVVVIYFTFVETKGYNLEEIDKLFESDHPVRESMRRTHAAVVVDRDNTVKTVVAD